MATGLATLLGDIAALVGPTASNLDDVTAGVAKAGSKTIAVVVDGTAVTPQYAGGIDPRRETPIIGRIAKGPPVNKGIILIGALLLSAFTLQVLAPLLMAGDSYLCFEGAHKIWGKLTGHGEVQAAVMEGGQTEDAIVKNTVRINFILSTEIMVIALAEVTEQNIVYRVAIPAVVAVSVTALVYGIVACLVRINSLGLHMASKESSVTRKMGRGLVKAVPKALSTITMVGVAVMLWVGGHLLVSGSGKFGWSAPHNVARSLPSTVPRGFLSWTTKTSCSLAIGFVFGSLIMAFQVAVGRIRGSPGH